MIEKEYIGTKCNLLPAMPAYDRPRSETEITESNTILLFR